MTGGRLTVADFQSISKKRKIVSLTAYTAPVAAALDPHCDLLLVGDSVAMVLYGMQGTQGANIEMMVRHGKAVVSHSSNAMVVVDLPYGTYEHSAELAVKSAKEIIKKTGACGVKLEGGMARGMMRGGIMAFAQGGAVAMQEGGEMDPSQFPRMDGDINEPGTEQSDDIPAMLSDGEFVMTARAVRGAGSYEMKTELGGIINLVPSLEEDRERGMDVMYKVMDTFSGQARPEA